jgi:hypothetical protein
VLLCLGPAAVNAAGVAGSRHDGAAPQWAGRRLLKVVIIRGRSGLAEAQVVSGR